jgi:hypothetical protein
VRFNCRYGHWDAALGSGDLEAYLTAADSAEAAQSAKATTRLCLGARLKSTSAVSFHNVLRRHRGHWREPKCPSRFRRRFLFTYGAGVGPSSPLLRPFIGLLYQLWKIGDNECGAISGMNE